MSIRAVAAFVLVTAAALLAGCARKPPEPVKPPPASVNVDTPILKKVTDYEDFAGRTEPFRVVELKSRVTGYLTKIHFEDGQDIKGGEPLFDIDDRIYKAEQGKAHAALSKARKHLATANENYSRVKELYQRGGEGKQEYDLKLGDKLEAEADVEATTAAAQLADTNLRYCRIVAPFDGRLSKRMMDEGNLVKADETSLTTIVRLDQIYATFDVDERTVIRLLKLVQKKEVNEKELSAAQIESLIGWLRGTTVKIAQAEDDDFPLEGTITFVDNQIDVGTGTLRVRATVINKKLNRPPGYALMPGQFVRVRLPIGGEREAVLVPEEALGADQGQRYVYVVGPKNTIERRNVRVGQKHDKWCVVEDRVVSPRDRVIVAGLLRVRPGAEVNPTPVKADLPK
jgi:multidrug efflux system membrane fusion protein